MYNTISDIDREIAELQCERSSTVLYWFEMGEADRDSGLEPQHSDNPWYLSGYEDRSYQLEIGFNAQTVFAPF